jgi:hypothetical protein
MVKEDLGVAPWDQADAKAPGKKESVLEKLEGEMEAKLEPNSESKDKTESNL